jgi:hypothetical protein
MICEKVPVNPQHNAKICYPHALQNSGKEIIFIHLILKRILCPLIRFANGGRFVRDRQIDQKTCKTIGFGHIIANHSG